MSRRFLSKKRRLLRLSDFVSVFKQSKRISVVGVTLFSRVNQFGYPRIGLAISKKYVKYAHERNRIKRYARETFRTYQHNLPNLDFVITVHSKNIVYLKNIDLIREFKKLWDYHQCLEQTN